ncbi:MAG: DUF1566 domain-containing protein [Bacteroidales bacterium]|nr:DUF1566 domain-containing protein [Bacteroidales bacterium]
MKQIYALKKQKPTGNYMLPILVTLVFILMSSPLVFAQVPLKINYQAILRNHDNQLIPDTRVGIQISILQGSVDGTPVYVETHNVFTNENGLVTIEIGGGDIVSGDLESIDWMNGPYFLKTAVDPNGGTDYTIQGVSQLLSVPYALFSAKAANAFSGDYTDLVNAPDLSGFLVEETDPLFSNSAAINITDEDITKLSNLSGINTGDQDLSGYVQISSLSMVVPANETDPVFTLSVANEITAEDTVRWNRKLDSYTETDPLFSTSVASGITQQDTGYWNHKLDTEVDGSVTNEIQTISRQGLTVTLSKGGGSFTDSVNVYTAGKDIDIADNTISVRPYNIGDIAFGGIVFWVDGSGRHGLVCAKEDLSTGMRWYAGTYGNTRALGDGPYAGFMNTSVIISSQVAIGDDGKDYAALLCSKLIVKDEDKSYGDWYLPSKEELMLMHKNLDAINAAATASKGTTCESNYYWSSTEYDNEQAWKMNLVTGEVVHYYKTYAARVRAVRSF